MYNIISRLLLNELSDELERLSYFIHAHVKSSQNITFGIERDLECEMWIRTMRVVPAEITIDPGSPACNPDNSQTVCILMPQPSGRLKTVKDRCGGHYKINETLKFIVDLVNRPT